MVFLFNLFGSRQLPELCAWTSDDVFLQVAVRVLITPTPIIYSHG